MKNNLNNLEADKINNMQMILGGSFAVHGTTYVTRENGVPTGSGCDTGFYTVSYSKKASNYGDISDETLHHWEPKDC